jgi:hypothetical protein
MANQKMILDQWQRGEIDHSEAWERLYEILVIPATVNAVMRKRDNARWWAEINRTVPGILDQWHKDEIDHNTAFQKMWEILRDPVPVIDMMRERDNEKWLDRIKGEVWKRERKNLDGIRRRLPKQSLTSLPRRG